MNNMFVWLLMANIKRFCFNSNVAIIDFHCADCSGSAVSEDFINISSPEQEKVGEMCIKCQISSDPHMSQNPLQGSNGKMTYSR